MTNLEESGLIVAMRPRRDTASASSPRLKPESCQPSAASRKEDSLVRRSMRCLLRHDSQAPAALVDALWSKPNELINAGHMLKDGDRCTVVRLNPGHGAEMEQPLVIKRYNAKGPLHTAVHAFMRTRAEWGWTNGYRLLSAGLLTPRPIAYVEDRRAGLLRFTSWLVNDFIAGRPLLDVVLDKNTTDAELRELAVKFVAIWRTLGLMRIGHGDMKATNFIVDRDRHMWLIDLDGMRSYQSSAMLRRERRKDLARFMKNWQDRPEVAAIFRARIGTG